MLIGASGADSHSIPGAAGHPDHLLENRCAGVRRDRHAVLGLALDLVPDPIGAEE